MFNLDNIRLYVLSALAVLIVLPLHELAHGYAAYKLGDDTAKREGRLTLNPFKHLDIFGTLCLVLFHFGWAKPVPINPYNLKKPKRDGIIISLAGPLSNLLCAFIFTFFYLLLYKFLLATDAESFLNTMLFNMTLFFQVFCSINIGLALFNLLPVPPLDGSKILLSLLPRKPRNFIIKHERKFYIGMFIWLFFGDIVKYLLLKIPLVAASRPLSIIANIFSLSDMLAFLFNKVFTLFISFWQLLPIF